MLYSEPELFRNLLERIARATARYLRAQIAAGATAVQLFDTWVGELTLDQYREFALPATQLLIEEIGAGETPVILYTKASSHLLAAAAESGANVLSVDWRVDLATVRELVGPAIALQGNVDPCLLLGPEEGVRRAARDAVESTGGARPHPESGSRNFAADAGGKCARICRRQGRRSGRRDKVARGRGPLRNRYERFQPPSSVESRTLRNLRRVSREI